MCIEAYGKCHFLLPCSAHSPCTDLYVQILSTKKRIAPPATFPVEMFLENVPQSTKIFGLAVLRFSGKCDSTEFMWKSIEQSRGGGVRKGNHIP